MILSQIVSKIELPDLPDILAILAVASIGYGCWLIQIWLMFIVVGILVLAASIFMASAKTVKKGQVQ
jgi:hypothetical protein